VSKLRSYRPSHAVVVAYLALFMALGGSSYAAIKVTGENVKNSSLTGKDLKNNSVTGADVKNQSLLSRDFKAGQLPQGPQGPQGPEGPEGEEGPPGFAEVLTVHESSDATTTDEKSVEAECPDGWFLVGGGYVLSSPAPIAVRTNYGDFNRWRVDAYETEPFESQWTVAAYAYCV
jgi:hypothetical protein